MQINQPKDVKLKKSADLRSDVNWQWALQKTYVKQGLSVIVQCKRIRVFAICIRILARDV
jgi:hypothetical protein